MNNEKITIKDLKISCYLYQNFTDNDKSLEKFYGSNKRIELSKKEDIINMINWLRSWGCRQFDKEHSDKAIKNIREWYNEFKNKIPTKKKKLWKMSCEEIKKLAIIFDELSDKIAGERNHKEIKIGPVGAAKILFKLNQNVFIPWDNPIINNLSLKKNGEGYVEYLIKVKQYLLEYKNIEKLPTIVNRPKSSPVKLIDEYFWVTITKKINLKKLYQK